MSRFLAITVAAALMASTANASSFFNSSSWSVEESVSEKKNKYKAQSLIGGFLALIGFDEKFSVDAGFDRAKSSHPFDGATHPKKQCDEADTTTVGEREEEKTGAGDSDISGPEPILFAF